MDVFFEKVCEAQDWQQAHDCQGAKEGTKEKMSAKPRLQHEDQIKVTAASYELGSYALFDGGVPKSGVLEEPPLSGRAESLCLGQWGLGTHSSWMLLPIRLRPICSIVLERATEALTSMKFVASGTDVNKHAMARHDERHEAKMWGLARFQCRGLF